MMPTLFADMTIRGGRRRIAVAMVASAVAVLCAPARPAQAQAPAPASSQPQPQKQAVAQAPATRSQATEEVDPLNCWWRTSISAVTVGQPFDLYLTCAVVETESASAVVDRARLDPKAIELAPFEVLGGSVAPDVRSGDHTFFQVQYSLRFVNEGFFNQDIALPNLSIAYRIQLRSAAQGASTQGMERRFAMPHQSLRVASLVPADSNDIRDATTLTFAEVDALASRGRLLTTSGVVVLGLAAVIALAGIGSAVGSTQKLRIVKTGLLSESAVLRGARAALVAVRKRVEGSGSWSADDVAQALTATRIVSACAVGTGASQRLAAAGEEPLSGALSVRRRFGTGAAIIVSGASTAKSLRAPLGDSRLQPRVDQLRDALTAFTAAQYRDAAPLDDAGLSAALASVIDVAGRVALERLPIVSASN